MTLAERILLYTKRHIDRQRRTDEVDFDLGVHVAGRHAPFFLGALAQEHTVRAPDHACLVLKRLLPRRRWLLHVITARASPFPPRADLRIAATLDSEETERRAVLDDDWFHQIDERHAVRMPYFMHPQIYLGRFANKAEVLRQSARQYQLGFAGSWGTAYDAVEQFGVLKRTDVLQHTARAYGPRAVGLASAAGRSDASRLYVSSVTDAPADDVTKHSLGPAAYLAFLGACNFALCPPGSMMPPAHNAIEAMAVGAIPVLNYAALFDPPLRDGVDCLIFRSAEDLAKLPMRLDALEATEIARMRAAVCAYYDQVLDGRAFARRLLQHPATQLRIVYNSEGGSIARAGLASDGPVGRGGQTPRFLSKQPRISSP